MKTARQKLSVLQRSEILLKLLKTGDVSELYPHLSAPQMRDLRNLIEQQVIRLSAAAGDELGPQKIKDELEPVPNYYYKQDCQEPLDVCYNETCLASNPICFSNKMKSQLEVLVKLVRPYLGDEHPADDGDSGAEK